ncbi:MAG: SCO family protein [Rubrivivax sp.]|nr:SCO family protein [Rubrivivax sp.]
MTACTRSAAAMALVLASALTLGMPTLARAQVQPLAPTPSAPDVAIEQQLGATLPGDLRFTTSDGRVTTLGAVAEGRAQLLVLGYYRCPQLCGLLMHGLLESLHTSRLPTSSYRIVRVSLDPDDTPAVARTRRAIDLAYARSLGGPPPSLDLLVGAAPQIAALARRVGLRYGPGDGVDGARIAHGAAVIVVTPDGRVARYLMGVRFEPDALREAVADASQGRIGRWTDRIALLCAHLDPRVGRHSEAVMAGLRGIGTLGIVLLAAYAWRHRRTPR